MDRTQRETLIQQYADGPRRLREALAKVPAEAMQWRPKPGDWSAHEIVCHAADSEVTAYARIRMVVAEKEPLIVGYDQEEWARRFDYHALPLEPSLAAVDAVRAATAAMLRRLPEDAWTRKGRHTEIGEYPAAKWLEIYAQHLEDHARQIEGNAAAWQTRRS
ncbi:MAG TPA: DinB family protein [Terriglobales bacterium]|nr:DinB family protein [Terriglobales bacterium]